MQAEVDLFLTCTPPSLVDAVRRGYFGTSLLRMQGSGEAKGSFEVTWSGRESDPFGTDLNLDIADSSVDGGVGMTVLFRMPAMQEDLANLTCKIISTDSVAKLSFLESVWPNDQYMTIFPWLWTPAFMAAVARADANDTVIATAWGEVWTATAGLQPLEEGNKGNLELP